MIITIIFNYKYNIKKFIYIYMIQFEFQSKEYMMTTTWDEMTLGQFIRVNKIQESHAIVKYVDEILVQYMCEALCNVEIGTFDELNFGQAQALAPYIVKLVEEAENFNKRDFSIGNDYFELDGAIYSYHKDANQYTIGEVSDIKTYISNKKNEWDYLADIATVMIRPATKMISEAGNEYWKLCRMEQSDFEPNRDKIMRLNLKDVTMVLRFFLNGLNEQKMDTQNYLKIREVQSSDPKSQKVSHS